MSLKSKMGANDKEDTVKPDSIVDLPRSQMTKLMCGQQKLNFAISINPPGMPEKDP